jgi:xanthine dehydrogenase YagR molybdenum-binding subunit
MQETETPKPLPQMTHRYDALSKVTGKAKFAYEFEGPFDRAAKLYAYVVQSTIPNGTLASIDRTPAERAPGVVAVLTPFNAPKFPVPKPKPPARRNLTVLQTPEVSYNGQPIAVVVAKTLPQAIQAARLLKIVYAPQPAKVSFEKHLETAHLPGNPGKEPAEDTRGDVAKGFAQSAVVLDETYITPIQNHNPMEPHGTIAWWEGEKLNVYDSTQYISGVKQSLAKLFSIPVDDVHSMCPYTGGGFGSKGSMWSHVPLCAMAAKVTGAPVKLVLGREQMFGPVGARPATINRIKLGANADGLLLAMQQDVQMPASVLETFVEHSANPTKMLYKSANNAISEKVVDVNLGVFTFMRAPGEAPGTAVLEIAMDELAEKLKMDPVQLRLVNYANVDPRDDHPWTGKHLKEAYQQAADRFGWSKRNATPRQMSEGNEWIGYGMATAAYPANRSGAAAVVKVMPGGKVYVGCGTQDLGTGMYTMMAETVAQVFGILPASVEVQLGDSTLPKAPVSGGSQSTASVTPAVQDAAKQAKLKLAEMAINDAASPFHGLQTTDIDLRNGTLTSSKKPSASDSIAELLKRNGNQTITAMGSAQKAESASSMTSNSWGAIFVEVAVDKDTHMVKVRRAVATYDIGTLMNKKTGTNQLVGGIVWGCSFALLEEAHIDPVYGRTANENLAEYHVPVNADIGVVDVTCLDIADTNFQPLGGRGIGEIGITGASAAVANAIYNATGKRIRQYPITPDKIMQAPLAPGIA